MIADVLAREIRSVLVDVYQTSAPAGSALSAISAAERRIGRPLPSTLRTYYALVGRHPRLARASPPRRAGEARGDRARADLFLQEQQDVCFYALRAADLALDDPPVFQGNRNEDTWYPDCGRLSSFLIKNPCWQAMDVLESEGLDVMELMGIKNDECPTCAWWDFVRASPANRKRVKRRVAQWFEQHTRHLVWKEEQFLTSGDCADDCAHPAGGHYHVVKP